MRDLDKALADIIAIRSQIAAGTAFRGYGPTALAATGGLALLTAGAQSLWLSDPNAEPLSFLAAWVVTAVLAAMILVLLVEALIQWSAILSRRKAAVLHEAPYVTTNWAVGAEGD